jgi:hypothetical protein
VKVAVLSLLLLLPLISHATEPQAYAYVSALQPPVWMEHGDQRTALAATAAILPGNRYITGSSGRLHIALADGSIVKLGETAEFELPALQVKQEGADNVLKGALKVLKGAFRYTTQALNFISKRELDVYVGPTVTIGIRGTDIWGKSDPTQDLVCLLHGKIKVSSPGQPEIAMDQAHSFYVVPQGQPPNPVAPVPEEKLKGWVPQTELVNGQPALQSNGAYSVVLVVYLDETQARRRVMLLNQKGYPAILEKTDHDGTAVFSVLIEGLSNAQSASSYADLLKNQLQLRNPRARAPAPQT